MILVATRNSKRPLRWVEAVAVPYKGAVFVRIDGVPRNISVDGEPSLLTVELYMARAIADAEAANGA